MFDVILCEFAKLKRSYFYLLVFGVICFFPLMLFVGWLAQGQHVTWNHYVIQIEQMSIMFINMPLFAITAAYIYTREHTVNTAQVLFTYPVSRTQIFLAKFIIAVLISSAAILLQLVLGFAFGLLLPHDPLTMDIFLGHIRMNCFILIYLIALLPLAVFISILCKNVILPIVCSGLATISTVIVIGVRSLRSIEAIHQYLPTMYAYDILSNSLKGAGGEKGGTILVKSGVYLYGAPNFVATAVFIVGIALCLYFYNRMDVD